MVKAPLLGLALAALALLPAAAAPATPEEAARLKTLFERYVGPPSAGEPSSVQVVPEGESYRVTLDLKRAMRGLEGFGVSIEPYSASSLLTPLPDGTWHVTSSDAPPLVAHFKEQVIRLDVASAAFDGIYDPALYGFRSSITSYKGYDLAQTAPNFIQSRHVDAMEVKVDGKPADAGTLAMTGHYLLTGIKSDLLFRSPPPPPPPAGAEPDKPSSAPPTAVTFASPSGTLDVGIDRLHAKELLDLWAFLVAHPDRDQLKASQSDFRGVLRAALPALGGLNEKLSLDRLTGTTPAGPVAAQSIGGFLDASAIDATAKVAAGLSILSLVAPTDQLPSWSRGLVPTDVSLNLGADGFHPAEAAAEAVNDFDLNTKDPFTAEQKAKILHLLMPGAPSVSIAPSRIASPLVDLRMEGGFTFGAVLTGQVKITAKGLEAAIAAVQAASQTDMVAMQALGPLVLARNLGKAEPDGVLSWVLALDGNGPLTVNGSPLQ